MKNIAEVLGSRKGNIVCIAPDDTVQEAVKRLAASEIGALLVMAEGRLVGLVSERDYARKVELQGKAADSTQVEEIMTKALICTNLNMRRRDAMALMVKNNIRHLPVLDAKKQCVGIVSIRDLVQELEEEED